MGHSASLVPFEAAGRIRRAALAGIIAPTVFLGVSFGAAAVRTNLIHSLGWKSWPSSMALGGVHGLPQIAAFLLLAACYPWFSLGALRPVLRAPVIWWGFLVIAFGDLLLAFPTDGPGRPTSWHGTLHFIGILVVTVATVVATVSVTLVKWRDPRWRSWRSLGAPVVLAGAMIGAAAGFQEGWAKVVYVVAVTAPVPLLAWLVRRDATGDSDE
jgi:Protein of unknown function (DUF998)